MKIWMDVTCFIQWVRPPVGIIRVEQEIIKWSVENLSNVGYFIYNADKHKFQTIEKNVIEQRLNSKIDRNSVFCFTPPGSNAFKSFLKHILKTNYRFFISFVNPNYHDRINHFLRKKLVEFNSCFNKIKKRLISLLPDKLVAVPVIHNLSHPFNNDDVILCAGLVWNYPKIHNDLQKIKKKQKLHYYAFCYDLIPVKFPHLCVLQPGQFAPYFIDLSHNADHVFCISECTQKDLKEFQTNNHLAYLPTSVVKLGSEPCPHELAPSREVAVFAKERYILLVSTIERRKNHETIYKAYLHLLDNGQKNLPKIFFIGMRGWGVDDFIKDLNLNPRIKDMFVIMSDVKDADLAVLYKQALFTVYPSYYEGWGLPVAESLNYGKMSIVSSASSLPEVGEDFVDYVNPYDIVGWAERIKYYLDNPQELIKREQKIQNHYQKNSWQNFAKQIYNQIIIDRGILVNDSRLANSSDAPSAVL